MESKSENRVNGSPKTAGAGAGPDRHLLARAVESSLTPLGLVDPSGRIVYANQATRELFGYGEGDDIVGCLAMGLAVDRKLAETAMHRAFGEGSWSGEMLVTGADGEHRLVLLSANRCQDGRGEQFLSVSLVDLTRQRRIENERERIQHVVQRAAAEWQATFDVVESPIVLAGPEHEVLRLNQAGRKLLGRPFQELIGRDLKELGDGEPWSTALKLVAAGGGERPADDSEGKTWLVSAVASRGAGRVERVSGDAMSGIDPPVDGSAASVRDLWVISLRDVTELFELQESLERSQSVSAMGALVAGVAHEVRNPLFSISAIVDTLADELGDDAHFEQYLLFLRSEVSRLTRLMENLLEYGKPTSSRRVVADPQATVDEARRGCELLAARANVVVEASMGREPIEVLHDPDRLEQVVKNLLENAIHASPPGSRVWLEASTEPENDPAWWRLEVRDSGTGFRDEDLARLTEPFFSRRRGGTGLGLAIVERIVEEHGGELELANAPDRGARAWFRLPLDEAGGA